MIDYELAKELKDAGYLQSACGGGIFLEEDGPKLQDQYPSEQSAYVPTLSELIEECGEDFETLSRFEGKFYCYLPHKEAYAQQFEGDTPEEAVAKLWLALNKKA